MRRRFTADGGPVRMRSRPGKGRPGTGQIGPAGPYDLIMTRRAAALVLTALTALVLAAGCGGGGSQTECGLDGCTITFPRSGAAAVSVLGIEARVVGVEGGTAELEIAGQRVTVPVGGETQVQGFTVGVERVTDTEVVVRIRP
jgi:hypothetical protein